MTSLESVHKSKNKKETFKKSIAFVIYYHKTLKYPKHIDYIHHTEKTDRKEFLYIYISSHIPHGIIYIYIHIYCLHCQSPLNFLITYMYIYLSTYLYIVNLLLVK